MQEIERSCENCIHNKKFYDKTDNSWYYENICSCRTSMFEGQDCSAVMICGKWKEDKRNA
jgi:hypothetical protein